MDSSINLVPLAKDLCKALGGDCSCPHDDLPSENPIGITADIPYYLTGKNETISIPYMLSTHYFKWLSPIILDLDGDGVETIPVDQNIHFDHDGNNFAETTGWVNSDDALLVWDRNGNGQIDDGGELFGNHTQLADGSYAKNGFEALAELDVNGDGVVDAADGAWNQLRLWKDSNGNGRLDEGELLTMAEAGVASLGVGYRESDKGVPEIFTVIHSHYDAITTEPCQCIESA